MSLSIKLNGKEILGFLARFIALWFFVLLVVIVAVLGAVTVPVLFGLVVAFFLLSVPLHFILRLCGRRGFYVRQDDARVWTHKGAFKRR
jgi:hypothetical protein